MTKEKYLENNYSDFIESGISVYDSTSVVYFCGESHYSEGNFVLWGETIKHLISRSDKKLLVFLEMPYNREYSINYFFDTGDSTTLNILAEENEVSNEYKKTMWELKRIRDTMISNKFEFKCVDVANSIKNAFSNIAMTIPNNEYPYLKAFDAFVRYGNKTYVTKHKAKKIIINLKKESLINDSIYRWYLGSNYEQFQNQVDAGIIFFNGVNVQNENGLKIRELYLYQNCKSLIEKNPDHIFFGQFGRAHVPISNQRKWLHLTDWSSFVSKLNTNNDSPVKGRVCSILYYYKDETELNYYSEPIIKTEDVDIFMKYSKSPFTIFKLDSLGTPFKEMSEKFQYLIINRY